MNIDLLSSFGPPKYPAAGCGICSFGLIDPLPVRVSVPLYLARAMQFDKGLLAFCECEAGINYRRYLTHVLADLKSGKDRVPGDYWQAVLQDAKLWQAEQTEPSPPTLHLERERV